jgi:hypothetical protein
MSLSVDNWKKVLDQPKNLALKAGGGTGISDALRKVKAAEDKFTANKTDMNALAITLALDELQKQCDKVIAKQGKLFTTACDYLKTVKTEAAASIKAWQGKIDRAQKYETNKTNAEMQRGLLRSVCADYAHKVIDAPNPEKLKAVWADFMKAFQTPFERYKLNPAAHDPNLQIAYEQAYRFNPKTDDFKVLHGQYVEMAKGLFNTIKNLPEIKPWPWMV